MTYCRASEGRLCSPAGIAAADLLSKVAGACADRLSDSALLAAHWALSMMPATTYAPYCVNYTRAEGLTRKKIVCKRREYPSVAFLAESIADWLCESSLSQSHEEVDVANGAQDNNNQHSWLGRSSRGISSPALLAAGKPGTSYNMY